MKNHVHFLIVVIMTTLTSTTLSAQEFWISAVLNADCGTVTDSDGNTYTTTVIGSECWMAENLNVGDRINGGNDLSNDGNIEKYCYDDLETNCNSYGGLYQWDEMMGYNATEGAQGICPAGWHIPSDADWAALKSSIGVPAGGELKSTGTVGAGGSWYAPNTGAGNSSGFTSLPGGLADNSGASFYLLGYDGYFWSSTEIDANYALTRRLRFIDDDIASIDYDKTRGLSVRCVKGLECGDAFTDPRDWQAYSTVKLDTQCWMAENLNVGDRIDGDTDQTNNSTIEKYCYNNSETNCDIYGGLYQGDEMMGYTATEGAQGICPDGWHIPTDAEWTTLTSFLGGSVGGKMKTTGTIEAGTGLWYDPNTGATNSSGFTGLPGGSCRPSLVPFGALGYTGHFWSSTSDASYYWGLHLLYDGYGVGHWASYKAYGYSLRCLQD